MVVKMSITYNLLMSNAGASRTVAVSKTVGASRSQVFNIHFVDRVTTLLLLTTYFLSLCFVSRKTVQRTRLTSLE